MGRRTSINMMITLSRTHSSINTRTLRVPLIAGAGEVTTADVHVHASCTTSRTPITAKNRILLEASEASGERSVSSIGR